MKEVTKVGDLYLKESKSSFLFLENIYIYHEKSRFLYLGLISPTLLGPEKNLHFSHGFLGFRGV